MSPRAYRQRDRTVARGVQQRIKTQTLMPPAHSTAILFCVFVVCREINMHAVDAWQTFATKSGDKPTDLAA
jgi:hypothetical protein